MRNNMSNLVAQYSRNTVFILAQRQDAGEDEYLATRRDESVLFRGLDDMNLPVQTLQALTLCKWQESVQYSLDLLYPRVTIRQNLSLVLLFYFID
jgi:hypothetical protein